MPMLEMNYLLSSLVFSSIGFGYFIYGKKQKRKIIYYTGIALIVFPYFATSMPAMYGIGVLLLFAPKLIARFDFD